MAKLKKQDIPFTQVANAVINDKNLSWKAKGLFSYLFSKPEGWDFAGRRISKDSSDGSKATYSGLKELEIKGYIERKKLGNGRIIYHLKYTDNPDTQKGHLDIDPDVQNGKQPKRLIAKRDTISNIDTESNIKEESNKDSNGQAVAEILSIFEKINPAIKRMYGNTTQRSAAERLISQFGLEKIKRGAEAAVLCLGQPFAPRITTPYLLELKWADLKAFYQSEQNKKLLKGKRIISST